MYNENIKKKVNMKNKYIKNNGVLGILFVHF